MRWLPVHLGQLAPTTLPQCRLVSNTRSAGLSLPLSFSLFLSLSLAFFPLSLSLCDPLCDPLSLSLSHKGGFGMFGGSLSPPGFEPSSTRKKRCAIPTELRRDAFCAVALTCSALYLYLPLSLCVSRSLSPSSSSAPSSQPPQGFFLCLCRLLHPPACCPLSGISPFARRCAQQRVEEPHGVSGYRVCLPEERSLEQP